MKKRILSLLLIAAMAFTVLAGCGSKDVETQTPDTEVQDPAFGADLAEFYNKIMAAAEEGPFMMDVAADAEMLENNYPGLKDIETKQLVVFAPAMSAVAIEFAFVEVANASDVEAVKTIFQTRIDNQVNGGAWYPETIEGWQNNSEIVVIDNYVCLFVCAEKDGMIEALRNGTEVPVWAKAQTPAEGEGDTGIMDMPVEDGPAAYDPETETPAAPETPAVEPSTAPVEPSTPAVNPQPTPEVKPETSAATTIDLRAFVVSIADSYGENWSAHPDSPMTIPVATMIDYLDGNYPGLSAIQTNQLEIYMPGWGSSVCEIALVEVANGADVDAVKDILQARIDAQIDGGAWYPESIEGWEKNSRIVTKGNYIMMIAYFDCDAVVDAFNARF